MNAIILQPAYFPCSQYFAILRISDCDYIIDDSMPMFISKPCLPIEARPIKELELPTDNTWIEKHITELATYTSDQRLLVWLHDLLYGNTSVSSIVKATLLACCSKLDIDVAIELSSQVDLTKYSTKFGMSIIESKSTILSSF